MITLMPSNFPKKKMTEKEIYSAKGEKRIARVALLAGCVHRTLSPQINEATIRLLNRHDIGVVVPKKNRMLWFFKSSYGKRRNCNRNI